MGVMLLGVTKEGRETGDEMRQLALFVISFSRDSKWTIYESYYENTDKQLWPLTNKHMMRRRKPQELS